MPGGAGIPREVCKTGEAPRPRGGQDAIRGKLLGGVLCFPRKFRATGTDHSTPPRNASPALGAQPEAAPLPPRSARHAGGGTNPFLLFFIGKIPLRPAPGTIRNPIRAGEILRIIAAQTSRAMHEGTVFSRHDIHPQSGWVGVFPVGAASLRQQILRRACEAEPSSGRTFSVFVHENCFHFVGKSRPCGAK